MAMAARDHWIEELTCPDCGCTGNARLSAADSRSWAVTVDSVPDGFKAIQREYGSNFYWPICEIPAEP